MEKVKPLLSIGTVTIYANEKGTYVRFVAGMQICNDGWGPKHGDPHYQPQTAYYSNTGQSKYLNADIDKYIVIPPQIRKIVPPKVMGCQARLTNEGTGVFHAAVTGEIGPSNKTGEAAYCLAKIVNPKITHNSGDKTKIYLYELWPGTPATVGERKYKLQ